MCDSVLDLEPETRREEGRKTEGRSKGRKEGRKGGIERKAEKHLPCKPLESKVSSQVNSVLLSKVDFTWATCHPSFEMASVEA